MKTHQEILIRIPEETIENLIHSIRGRKVMFDRDLANLYEVPTKVLKQAVKHNMERFPEDFMFQLTKEETQNWRSQFVTSNWAKMGIRRNPFVFTQNGVAMLSSILNSKRAVQVNIQIMRTFTKLQQILGELHDLEVTESWIQRAGLKRNPREKLRRMEKSLLAKTFTQRKKCKKALTIVCHQLSAETR